MKFIDTLNRAQKQAAPARLNQAPNRAPRGPSTGYSGNYDVIPAEWGHTLITFFPPDDDAVDPDTYNVRFNLGYSPIVAWRIDRDGNAPAIAISLHGDSTGEFSGVQAPNGYVYGADCYCARLEEWVVALRRRWKASRVTTHRAALRVVGGTVLATTTLVRA